MSALVHFPVQIAKLIPRLASDHDGEVVATARAINRTLKAAGLDFHAVAQAVERRANIGYQDRDRDMFSWAAIANWCREHHSGRLSPKEYLFVRDMCGWTREPTEKQRAWLEAIVTKLERRP